ncbi:MAG: mechanosensitive ion channel family protein [Acidobacteriota bacterium]
MNSRYLLPYAAVLALILSASAAAQEESAEVPPDESVEVYEVPVEHRSARATMRTFFDSFATETEDPDLNPLDIAAACLDLSGISEPLRVRQGRELALQLKAVLDKTELIDLQTVPDDPQAAPWELDVFGEGFVRLAPNENGEWLFDAATVQALPDLLTQVRDRETIAGVTEVKAVTPAMWLRSQMPASLLERGFLMEHWQWLALLVLVFIAFLVDRVVATICRNSVANYLRQHLEEVDPIRLKRAMRPVGLIAAGLFSWAAIYWLGLPTSVLATLLVAVHFTIATSFVWAFYRMVDIAAAILETRAAQTGNKFDDLLVPLVRKSSKVIVTVFGLVFIADTLNLPIRSILAGLGIGGLAVALAAQDLVKNLFGSLLVIMDRPFSVGDYVKVGSVDGTVEELGFRSTRLRTPENSLVTLPNSHLITSTVDNLGARPYRRWRTTLGLTYDTPVDKIEAFCEGIRELIRSRSDVRQSGYYVVFNQFSASSLDVLLQLHFDVPGYAEELEAKQSLGFDIMRLADELGVEFAFPTQTVHVQGGGQ